MGLSDRVVGTTSRPLPRLWRLGVLAVCVAVVGAGCGHRAVKPSWTYTDFKAVTFDPFPGMASQGRPLEITQDSTGDEHGQ